MTDDAAQYNNRAAQSNIQQTACNQLNAVTQFQRPAPAPIPQFHWSRIGPEADVTDEMVKEAREIDAAFPNAGLCSEYFRDIYRAMAALAPVPLVSPAEAAMRVALLRILGDMPSPSENPWERCRCIAAQALGYKTPGPMAQVSLAADAMRKELAQAHAEMNAFSVALERKDAKIVALQDALKQRTDERDTANADLAELSAVRWNLVQQVDDLQKELVIERMLHALRAKEAAALQDALAKAITPTQPQPPDPIANAIRPRETDRRRMGQ